MIKATSLETAALMNYAAASGVPHVVTDLTTPGVHAPHSYHYEPGTGGEGLAADFAFKWGAGAATAAQLLAIQQTFVPQAAMGRLAELFYTGAEMCVFRGRYMKWDAVPTGARIAIEAAHRNHVHVAVHRGTILNWQGQQVVATREEAMTMVIEPVAAIPHPKLAGGWIYGRRGHTYSWGIASHYGNWDDGTRSDPDRWCVGLVPTATGNGYFLVSNRGEVYGYGDAADAHPGNYKPAKSGDYPIVGAIPNNRQLKGGVTLVRDDGIRLNDYALPDEGY